VTWWAVKSGLRFSAKAAAPSLASSVTAKTSRPACDSWDRPPWWSVSARDDLVDQAPSFGLFGRVLLEQEPDLAGSLLADDPGQVRGAEPAVERADPRARLAEPGVVRGYGQVAQHVQDVAAADGQAVHRRGPVDLVQHVLVLH
jgi:hypothetical protein